MLGDASLNMASVVWDAFAAPVPKLQFISIEWNAAAPRVDITCFLMLVRLELAQGCGRSAS